MPTVLTIVRRVLTVLTLALNVFVYFYPDIINEKGQCEWHEFEPKSTRSINMWIDSLPEAIKRPILLNLPSYRWDPEKESNSTHTESGVKDIHMLAFGDPQINGNWPITPYIKRLDNLGNDYYLGHIYATMKHRLQPSHVAVMGDLFSSQWIYDSEFYNRTYRFVERLFPRDLAHKQTVLDTYKEHKDYDWQGWLHNETHMDPLDRFNSRVYKDVYDWTDESRNFPNFDQPLFINLTGNHDIGYSGDATWQHMARFHLLFGKNNYVINYNSGKEEPWRLVVLDSLTLEGPALQNEFIEYTWSFLEYLQKYENPNFNGSTVLLTHVPFYKKAGLCKDGPEHVYYPADWEREAYKQNLLRSQNHLSYDTTQKVLDIVFPNKNQNGVILTGHDHHGCDSWYNYETNSTGGQWVASKEARETDHKPIHEVVVKSMMGDFDGQTGIMTGHFDYESHSWQFAFSYCSFSVQHIWWASKVVSAVTILLQSAGFLFGW